MGFTDIAVGGVNLIRQAIQSPGYIQGSSGWTINQDGSAEFNNVTVRGTVVVGNANGQYVELSGSPQPEVIFGSGNPLETAPAGIYTGSSTEGAQTVPNLTFQSAEINNGETFLDVVPPNSPTYPGFVQMDTTGATAVASGMYAGVTGYCAVGLNGSTSDIWTVAVNNENSVLNGSTLYNPALILGDVNTPRSRLYVSVSEMLSVTGANQTETLYLNTNNGQTAAGGIVNPWCRQQSTTIAGPFTPGTGGYVSAGGIAGVPCPASGTMTVWMRFAVIGNTAFNVADYVAGCPNIVNTTQSTTPFVATDNRCAQVDGTWLNSTNQLITVFTQICATGLGNPGDSLTITAQFHQNSNATGRFYNIEKVEIGFIPSL